MRFTTVYFASIAICVYVFISPSEAKKCRYEAELVEKFEQLAQLQLKVERIEQAQEGVVSEITARVTEELELFEDRIQVPLIAFSAYDTADNSITPPEVFVFTNILLNEGEGYDTNTGLFTAPVSGLYNFAAHICSRHDKYTSYAITLGDSRLAVSTEYANGGGSCSSVSTLAMVNSGENVRVVCTYGQDTAHLYEDSNRRASFTGVLLNKT